MYIGYKRLTEGRDHDLNKEYKEAILKYAKGVHLILNELEKEKNNPTEDVLCKLEKYIERINVLKKTLDNPLNLNLPQQPNTIPTILIPTVPE